MGNGISGVGVLDKAVLILSACVEGASLAELVRAYQAMASTHETNTIAMNARDRAEGAKWG